MRKALIPMLASLALCGAATAAFIATNAHAQPDTHKPMMVASVGSGTLMAQNSPAPPPPDGRGMRPMRNPADFAARMTQRCEDHYAREVGRLAFLETRLNLTASEQPLYAGWKDVKLGIAKRQSADCAQRVANFSKDRQRPDLVQRMGREEDMLKKRVADLDAERPALTALYNALSPEQREAFAPHRHMMMARGMDRGMMRHRPMEINGDHPPAPPPQ